MSLIRTYCQNLFIYLIFGTIITIYYVNVYVVWGKVIGSIYILMLHQLVSGFAYLFILIFTTSTFMMVWCLVKTMLTDPGKVPQNWGFFLDDSEQKKRRFCLLCHIFKPERCHHCSACNRCVLNMDHHCPWINNCVGFQNRKYFLQMLMYVICTTLLSGLSLFYGVYLEFDNLLRSFHGEASENYLETFIIIGAFAVSCIIFGVISSFFRFHIELVLSNRTTIENLERKRMEDTGQKSNQANEINQFDIGQEYNWLQVFGTNRYLWFLPITSDSGSPVGDGVVWPKRYQGAQEQKLEDIQSPHFTSPKTNENSQQPIHIGYQQGTGREILSAQHQNTQNYHQNYGFVGGQNMYINNLHHPQVNMVHSQS